MRQPLKTRLRNLTMSLLGLAGALGALWWAIFALKPYDIGEAELLARYQHAVPAVGAAATVPEVVLGPVERIRVGQTPAWAQSLTFTGVGGDRVLGRLVHPADPALPAAAGAAPQPVLLAMHALGRTHWRWWQANYKDRPTLENTHRVAEAALRQGHAVVALDARGHGERKDPQNPLLARDLLRDLKLWGQREPYERLIIDTVRDYRLLLDWLAAQPRYDPAVRATGYSMGAQMALLLAGVDPRVRSVAAIVPPGLGARVAAVAPVTVAPRLAGVEVWLLTADDDEVASVAENAALYAALPGPAKQHLRFAGGHVLPADYVERLAPWFERR